MSEENKEEIVKTVDDVKKEYEDMLLKMKEESAKEQTKYKEMLEKIAEEKRSIELEKLDEKSKAEFLQKEKEEKLHKELAEAREAKRIAEEESKSFKEEKKAVELDKEKNKLIDKYPLLKVEISKLKSWEGINAFHDIKDSLIERAEKLAKYDEINKKSGYNVFSNEALASEEEKSEFESILNRKKEEIVKKMTRK